MSTQKNKTNLPFPCKQADTMPNNALCSKYSIRPRLTLKGFTLVELIVVIVILAILATVAFLSFSSQSSSARDSTRLADMSNITKWLSVFNAMAWSYPKPDKSISITASGITIWYQWYAGSNLLNMIKISDWWKDPLDNATYTYSTNANQSKLQILGFLEDGNNIGLSLNPLKWDEAKAEPNSYSWRYIITRWDRLGVILNGWNMVPAQSFWANIDVVATAEDYIVQFTNSEKISGSWQVLKSMRSWWDLAYWLVWYWSFDEWNWSVAFDSSSKWNNWTLLWGASWTWWKVWGAIYFDWADDIVSINNSTSLNPWNWNEESVSFYVKRLTFNSWDSMVSFYWTGTYIHRFEEGATDNKLVLYLNNGANNINLYYNNFLSNEYYNFIITRRNNDMAKLYVNWKLVDSKQIWTLFSDSDWSWYVWWRKTGIAEATNSIIDEVRIYNRVLTASEVSSLYNSSK
ncbi:MAG: hypothetical protein ACD_3C00079G0008 [uncultured bacterium (gcode 4)]|uniref:Prepilin-type N-terminal cleavage/methylation domain-containing protein n=1 Tax=uncultured bacterium (gcode 4) TaxID=1234023 RepID=K2G239_9BACT|nr:MAG: hypothetical protein ACD_3C00079G0008 [uncultured bacterium (gcode 4)]